MAEIEHLKELITPSRSSTESFESLETTCKFLIMAINRSQDYVKASSNIALTPILDTVNVREVLGIVQKCIVNTKCGRIVNVHPLGDVCAFLITDHHYLMENLLCLVSNASKYSDRGAIIDVRLALLPPKADGKADDEAGRMVLVTVEDNGIGITETAQQQLFQPFKQVGREDRKMGRTSRSHSPCLSQSLTHSRFLSLSTRHNAALEEPVWVCFPCLSASKP